MPHDVRLYLEDMLEAVRRVQAYTIVHVYFAVNLDIVWDVVTNKLPQLEQPLLRLLAQMPAD